MFLHPPFLGPIQQPISFVIMSETYISYDWLNQINFTKRKSIFVKWCYIFIMWQKDSQTYHQISWFWGHYFDNFGRGFLIHPYNALCLPDWNAVAWRGRFKIFSDLENCPMPLKKKKKCIKENFRQTSKNRWMSAFR